MKNAICMCGREIPKEETTYFLARGFCEKPITSEVRIDDLLLYAIFCDFDKEYNLVMRVRCKVKDLITKNIWSQSLSNYKLTNVPMKKAEKMVFEYLRHVYVSKNMRLENDVHLWKRSS